MEKRYLLKIPYVEDLDVNYQLRMRYREQINGRFVLDSGVYNSITELSRESLFQMKHIDIHFESIRKTLRNIVFTSMKTNDGGFDFYERHHVEFEFIMFPAEDSAIVPA